MPTATNNGAPYPLGTDPLGETDLRIKALAEWADRQTCKVYRNAVQTFTTGVPASILWDAEDTDLNANHSLVTNTNRLTCTKAGRYVLMAQVSWVANAAGYRALGFIKNGATYCGIDRRTPAPATTDTYQQIFGSVKLAVNDYVELQAIQTSGGNLNAQAGLINTYMEWFRSGDA